MKKSLLVAAVLCTVLFSKNAWSESKAFTISVTLPPHVLLTENAFLSKNQFIQKDQVIRNNQTITISSIVVP